MNNVIFGKTMENVRKHRDINFTITEERRNYLVSEPNYHTAKFLTEYILEVEMKKNNNTRQSRDTYEKTCFFRT